jgi:AraC family transcriptional regulator of adaptative response / DNA-3-methyladenine glycosylase II
MRGPGKRAGSPDQRITDDFEACYRAVKSRDCRFDGRFFTAVTTTGIYCRPSCPALTPHPGNVRFYPSAAAAQEAGFRACKRCRPSALPGSPEWEYRDDVVARAMRLINDGELDRGGLDALAKKLGYGPRQVQRILRDGTGAGPVALARAQRSQSARELIESTEIALGQIAFAAGFSSVRQFNETVKAVFGSAPNELRLAARTRRAQQGASSCSPIEAGKWHRIRLRLGFRLPLSPGNLFGHLAATAVPGVEEVRGATYRRTLRLAGGPAIVALTPLPDHVRAELLLSDLRDLVPAVNRCRRMLDLDADPLAVQAELCADPQLGPCVRAMPGRRVPGTVDGAELAIRAVLAQQVTAAAARTMAGMLATKYGMAVKDPDGGLCLLFPTPEDLKGPLDGNGAFGGLPVPGARKRALTALVQRLAAGDIDLGPGADRAAARRGLAAVPGIGAWTVEIVAMRALGDPDGFPATDSGLRRGAALVGLPGEVQALVDRSQRWRPWRSYATQYIWAACDHPMNQFPPLAPTERSFHAITH